MRFRLFRSRAFWFGVTGLAFLLWGWWVSMGYESWVGFGGTHQWRLGQLGGEIYAWWDVGGWPDGQFYSAEHGEMPLEAAREWRLRLIEERHWFVPPNSYAFIPYYWIVLGYLAVWAGLLIWRKRMFDQRPVE